MIYFLVAIERVKYPTIVDKRDPAKTPILTPSIYCTFSTKAKFPTNKLMVKPIPVKIDTPYILNHVELSGICAILSFTEKYENNITPNCLPKKSPTSIPRGTGSINDESESPLKETPALANANNGMIIKATYGLIECSIFISNE